MISQMIKVNSAINEQLDQAREDILSADIKDRKGLQEVIVKLSAEIRKQMSLQLSIAEIWHSQKEVANFQRTVLDIIGDCEPRLKNEIIRKLKEQRIIRQSVSIT